MALTRQKLEELLGANPPARIGLIGDGCVDIYWEADMRKSELSREVPHHPLPVVEERFSLGGGANVAANMAALGARDLRLLTILGRDWRGAILRALLGEIGLSDRDLICAPQIVTPAYCKPIRSGISGVRYEDPRIDFANHEPLLPAVEAQILEKLRHLAREVDLLVVSDQLANGCITSAVIDELAQIGRQLPVVVDSRSRIDRFRHAILKPNEVELARALNLPPASGDQIEEIAARAARLGEKAHSSVLVTLGEHGALWHGARQEAWHVPAYAVQPPIDFVGAGDSFLAGFAVALAQGAEPRDAIQMGALAASITVQKLGTTGTASPKELRAALAQRGM